MTGDPPAGSADVLPPAVGALTLRLLGTFAVAHDGRTVEALPSDKACALLAMLAVDGAPIARSTLVARLWPAAEPERARLSLRVALSALRRLAPGRVRTDAATAAFAPQPGDTVDAVLVAAASDSADPDLWRAAAEAYAGPLLGGRLPIDTPGFAAWRDDAAHRLDDQARTVLLRLADTAAGDDPAAALHALRRAAAIDPLDEPTQRHVALALARRGEHGAALSQLAALRVALSAEMGVDPAPETLALRERIAAARERQAPPSQRSRPTTAFVGRAAQLARLERWLSDPSSRPDPDGGLDELAPPPDPDHPLAGRLVTIAGPGGMGKTRLAIELAQRATQRLLDGACVVLLSGLEPGRSIEPSVAAEFDLPPASGADVGDQLAHALEQREIVLVLDNVEHVRDAAAELITRLLAAPDIRIVTTSREALGLPFERVLVLDGLSYPGRADDAAGGDGFDAVSLFAAAARRIDPAFDAAAEAAAVGAICRLVDGLPLALELAAAWTATESCASIAARLATDLDGLPVPRGLPARHAGLDAVFDYSWQLLSGADRIAFARLCVCRGGFDAAAARAVAGAASDQLERLVRQSLVRQVAPDRFDIHTFLRAAGARRLGARDALAVQVAGIHARYFLGTLAELGRASGAESPAFAAFADGNADNLAAAWRHAVGRRDRPLVAAVALDLVAHAFAQGSTTQGIACCDEAIAVLAAADGASPVDAVEADSGPGAGAPVASPALVARLHAERAAFELRAGHAEVAEAWVGRALEALAPLGDDPRDWPAAARAAASVALRQRGVLRRMAGRGDDAAADLDVARRHAEAAGEARLAAEAAYHRAGVDAYRGRTQACVDGTAAVLADIEGRGYDRLACALTFTLAVLHDRLGQHGRAAAAARRCQAIAVDADYRVGEMNAATALGLVDYRSGAFDAAILHYERAIQLAVDAGHHLVERNARLGLADTFFELGRPADARHHIERARTQAEAEGYRRTAAFATVLRARLERCGHRFAAAERSAADGLAAFEALGDSAGVAMARAELGVVWAWSGDVRAAATLDGAVAALEAAGEAPQVLVARLHRARLDGSAAAADRLADTDRVRAAAVAAGLPTLVPMADVVSGHIRRSVDPVSAAAAYAAAQAGFVKLGQAHLAIEAVAGLLRCPGGLAPGAAALHDAQQLTPVLLQQHVFGVPDPAATVAAFRDALAVLGDGRAAAVGALRVADAGDTER